MSSIIQVSAVRRQHHGVAQLHAHFSSPILCISTAVNLRDTNETALQLCDPLSTHLFTMSTRELRKRKDAPPAPAPPAKKKAPAKAKKADTEKTVVEKVQDTVTETVEAVKEAVAGKSNGEASEPAAKTSGSAKTGDSIDLSTFGGEIETHDGKKTTLAKLVEESKGGVVLFTYPKASTPGCTFGLHHLLHIR